MPSLPSSGGGASEGSDDIEIMKNTAFLIKESGMDYNTVMQLPYAVYLSLMKQFRIMKLEETEEGREYLERCRTLSIKEADLGAIRKLKSQLENKGES